VKKILLDTNVILDFALKREPFYENARAVFCETINGNLQGYITASMATDIFYLLQKTNGKAFAMDTLADLLVIIDVLTVCKEDVHVALHSGWVDFEDALQAHVADRCGMDAIITRNLKDFDKVQYLDIVHPSDFIQYLDTHSQ
jgi:predicted nucleic acid-binding protein